MTSSNRDIFVPTTISAQAQLVLRQLIELKPYARIAPAPDDLDAWRRVHDGYDAQVEELNNAAVERTGVTVTDANFGGVPVLDIHPKDWKNNGKVLLYIHGGAYTIFSAHSTLVSSGSMSRATGLRVISVDYTTAPFAQWKEIQEQVITVFEALLVEGYTMQDIALYGDSAGGGLAISTVFNLRDRGTGMPAAVVLWSPWADISDTGDTNHTIMSADPTLSYDNLLRHSAVAYAGDLQLTDARVSPLYGDFSQGFPPTLIQGGTKEIFLSTCVRLYQALEAAGQDADLDIYEGMWHVFQQHPALPEAQVALRKSAAFVNKHFK